MLPGASRNATASAPGPFTLLGIPGLESLQAWLSIPFCSMYFMALLGNLSLLLMVKTEPSLHEPMYLFLCMLSLTDLVLSSSTLPKLLAIFWFGRQPIGFSACLAQMFFIHSFTAMESGFFLAMAYDRYVAICNPLRHATVLTNAVVAKIGLAVVVRGVVLFFPHPFLVGRLPFCKSKVIAHSYCEFMALVKLACADTAASRGYSLSLAFLIGGFDVCFISLSYALILRTVCRLPSKEAGLKAQGTCSSHICVILVFYTTAVFSFLTHRFGHNVPHAVHIFIANVYLVVPPTLNPIIYGVRTKKIRDRVVVLVQQCGV
ncbi:olfactory receptor 52P1-like isoform X22 [Podarcis raffonei]|uniref:olfactory receptor 52P1-like isoform X22 n=1 Tax=Podarcis raffonei TaxID=65483 RepID=UPI0023298356|nr:olfactory receptor 52P1-like isoform X22 [Podarcis raffonei]